MPQSRSRFLVRRTIVVGTVVLGLLWAAVAAEQLAREGQPLVAVLALLGMTLTWGLAFAIRRYQSRLEGIARTDPLTGLANHRGFHDGLEAAIAEATRSEGEVTVVLADLDDFKGVNDARGHSHGDRVLIALADRLRACVRAGDLVGRIGGEEFAMVVRGGADRAADVASRIRAAVAHEPVLGEELTCSAGTATFPGDATDSTTLCALADAAMYSAKRAGKDRVRSFDPELVRHDWTSRQAAEMEAALAAERPVEAVFQPVVSLATGRVVGYEALARFPQFQGRPIPAIFAQAQGCGLGPALEAAAIRAALEPIGRPPGTHLALNVSPSALASNEIAKALPEDLTDLVIELTEHEVFPDDEALVATLRGLRDRGARIAIDDTGAGYAGLKHLMRVNPDIVKLDRDLTRAIHTDPARMALVESFVRFARRIGAVVCAEGIESLDDLAALANLDVEWGQGYALAMPSPPWTDAEPSAVAACRASLSDALRGGPRHADVAFAAGDRGLERLSGRLAAVRTRAELEETLVLVAAEIHAERVALSAFHPDTQRMETLAENLRQEEDNLYFPVSDFPLTERILQTQEAAQVLVGDPDADPTEVDLLLRYGLRSLLMVPVIRRGESLGLIEVYSATERSWTRTEINRARIIASQFASVIEVLTLESAD